MSEPVTVAVALHGNDVELQVANACVQLLDQQSYARSGGSAEQPSREQRARIAAYLAARYARHPVSPSPEVSA